MSEHLSEAPPGPCWLCDGSTLVPATSYREVMQPDAIVSGHPMKRCPMCDDEGRTPAEAASHLEALLTISQSLDRALAHLRDEASNGCGTRRAGVQKALDILEREGLA